MKLMDRYTNVSYVLITNDSSRKSALISCKNEKIVRKLEEEVKGISDITIFNFDYIGEYNSSMRQYLIKKYNAFCYLPYVAKSINYVYNILR